MSSFGTRPESINDAKNTIICFLCFFSLYIRPDSHSPHDSNVTSATTASAVANPSTTATLQAASEKNTVAENSTEAQSANDHSVDLSTIKVENLREDYDALNLSLEINAANIKRYKKTVEQLQSALAKAHMINKATIEKISLLR